MCVEKNLGGGEGALLVCGVRPRCLFVCLSVLECALL